MSIEFGAFDPEAECERTERCLPHWFQPGVATFITYRTADSLPQAVVEIWKREQEEWLRRQKLGREYLEVPARHKALPPATRREFLRFRSTTWHRHLDECHGACELIRPEIATIVDDSLRHFDGQRYDLDSFVVMPNHVHLLVQFRLPTTLRDQTDSWLHYSARLINRIIKSTGAFWQSEPFDHLVRSAEQFEYLRQYIKDNPRLAGLEDGKCLYYAASR
jgi:putative transposase